MQVINSTGLAAAGTVSGGISVKGSRTASIMYSTTGNHERYVELSDNGVNWYELLGGGANAATTVTAGVSGSGSITFFTGGAPLARIRFVNTSGGAINVTAFMQRDRT